MRSTQCYLFIGLSLVSLATVARGDEFRPTKQSEFFAADGELEMLYDQCEFTEGPAAAADGTIYFSDIGNRILRFDPATKKVSVYRDSSGRSNGLLFDPKGRLIACEGANGGNRRISITDAEGVKTLTAAYQGKKFNSPNDLALAPNGKLYFTDPRYSGDEPRELDFEGVFVVDPDGTTRVATKQVQKPNGILISADGKTAYVADNNNQDGGNRHLLRFRIGSDGTFSDKKVLFDFGSNSRGIDGMTMDRRGNVFATAGRGDASGVYVFGPDGQHLARIRTPGPPTNCTFGVGKDAKVLYITASIPVQGQRKAALYRTTVK